MENSYRFVCECGCEIEFAGQKAAELDKYIENEANKLAAEKAEIVLNENKEQYQLDVLKQFQENDIRKEGVELSTSSPLITDT